MLRFVLILSLVLSLPAMAADWASYTNHRFGYALVVPGDFFGRGESANGDGQIFDGRRGETLTVWGGHLLQNFTAEVAVRQQAATDRGWHLTFKTTTPRWASFSAVDGSRNLYQRMIALCDTTYAAFRIEYRQTEIERLNAVIDRLARTLRGTRDCR